MANKTKGAKVGAKVGARVAPKAGKLAGKAAVRAGKSEAKLLRAAMSSKEPATSRWLKYGLFALGGLVLGSILARSRSEDSSYTGTTGPHTPDAGSPAGQRGETWGSGTPTGGTPSGTAYQSPSGANQTGAGREYSDPSQGPLIGEQRRGSVEGVGESQDEIAQRVRTRIGEDPRTADMPRVNVEVIGGVAELRGPAPTETAKQAAGEIAASVEGVTEVRNLISVS